MGKDINIRIFRQNINVRKTEEVMDLRCYWRDWSWSKIIMKMSSSYSIHGHKARALPNEKGEEEEEAYKSNRNDFLFFVDYAHRAFVISRMIICFTLSTCHV
jgi:hypothetical protein